MSTDLPVPNRMADGSRTETVAPDLPDTDDPFPADHVRADCSYIDGCVGCRVAEPSGTPMAGEGEPVLTDPEPEAVSSTRRTPPAVRCSRNTASISSTR